MFLNAAAFTDNTFFCVGLWMSSSLKPSNMENSGVTDFSCGGNLRNINIQIAVNDWIAGGTKKDNVIATYGDIKEWDTSEITSMRSLFNGKSTFNEDISKWDVSQVTTMANSTLDFHSHISHDHTFSSSPLSSPLK